MSMNNRFRTLLLGIVAVLAFALAAPIAVHAEDQVLPVEDQVTALAPIAGPSWDETSGYGSVEASRAAAAALLAPVAAPSWDQTSGYGSVEASRAGIAMDVRWAPARAIMDQALALGAAAAVAWDDTSGYGAVEASRAANALPAPPASFTSQVSPDVRWAPAAAIVPVPEADVGAVVAAANAWDESSGYGAGGTSRAETAEN